MEVVSPNDRFVDVEEKAREWLDHGCKLVWIVNPKARTVTVLGNDTEVRILAAADELTADDVLPGFCHRVDDLFPA